jgi:hypothetical protein
MFLVLKRFPMDDVPIGLCKTKREALALIIKDQSNDTFMTNEQSKLMQLDAGLAYCGAYLLVEFNKTGEPIKSSVEVTQ